MIRSLGQEQTCISYEAGRLDIDRCKSNQEVVKCLAICVCTFLKDTPGRMTISDEENVNNIITGKDLKYLEKAVDIRQRNLNHLWKNQDYISFYNDYNLTVEKCRRLRSVIENNIYIIVIDDANQPPVRRITFTKESSSLSSRLNLLLVELRKSEINILSVAQYAMNALNSEERRLNSAIQLSYSTDPRVLLISPVMHDQKPLLLTQTSGTSSGGCCNCVIL